MMKSSGFRTPLLLLLPCHDVPLRPNRIDMVMMVICWGILCEVGSLEFEYVGWVTVADVQEAGALSQTRGGHWVYTDLETG